MGAKTAAPQLSSKPANQSSADISSHPTQSVRPAMGLQQRIGNAASMRLLRSSFIQPKLTVSNPEDESEREADRVADQVMRMPDPSPELQVSLGLSTLHVQRMCLACDAESEGKNGVAEENGIVQGTKVSRSSAQGHRTIESQSDVIRGSGRPLGESTRSYFQPRFGHDFSDVRVHTDPQAAKSAKSINALAYTLGHDIVFGGGKYQPEATAGKTLLAHELAHIVQQAGGTQTRLATNGLKRVQAKSVKKATTPSNKTSNEEKDTVLASLDECRKVLTLFFSRYRRWLSHNMIQFLADVLESGESKEALESFKSGGFGEGVLKEAVVNAISAGAVDVGAKYGGKQFAGLFLSMKAAKAVGGIFSFVVGTILEYFLGKLFDQTAQIIHATADQIDGLVNDAINPMVDDKASLIMDKFALAHMTFERLHLTNEEWKAEKTDIVKLGEAANQAVLDVKDLSLYRQAALMANVYTDWGIEAETKAPRTGVIQGVKANKFSFVIQHKSVRTGQTQIQVAKDNSIVMLELESFDCDVPEDGGGIVKLDYDVEAKDRPDVMSTLDRQFFVELYRSGTIFDDTIPIWRVFNVSKKEFGVWYHIEKGTYKLHIFRSSYHPVALCGVGKYSVE